MAGAATASFSGSLPASEGAVSTEYTFTVGTGGGNDAGSQDDIEYDSAYDCDQFLLCRDGEISLDLRATCIAQNDAQYAGLNDEEKRTIDDIFRACRSLEGCDYVVCVGEQT